MRTSTPMRAGRPRQVSHLFHLRSQPDTGRPGRGLQTSFPLQCIKSTAYIHIFQTPYRVGFERFLPLPVLGYPHAVRSVPSFHWAAIQGRIEGTAGRRRGPLIRVRWHSHGYWSVALGTIGKISATRCLGQVSGWDGDTERERHVGKRQTGEWTAVRLPPPRI